MPVCFWPPRSGGSGWRRTHDLGENPAKARARARRHPLVPGRHRPRRPPPSPHALRGRRLQAPPVLQGAVSREALDAVVRYEDRFFHSHPGINPLDRPSRLVHPHGHPPHRRLDHHHAARPQASGTRHPQLARQARADALGAALRHALHQGRDPHGLSDPDALWRQRRGHRGRLARLLRQARLAAHRRRVDRALRRAPEPRQAPSRHGSELRPCTPCRGQEGDQRRVCERAPASRRRGSPQGEGHASASLRGPALHAPRRGHASRSRPQDHAEPAASRVDGEDPLRKRRSASPLRH